MGAPIVNNGYYDIPINNQYSNKPFPRDNIMSANDYNFNQNINLEVNNGKQNYMYNQSSTIPSSQLNYYDANFLSSDSRTPLLKRKEQTYNVNESFTNQYQYQNQNNNYSEIPQQQYLPSNQDFLNTTFIPNVSKNYWNNNVQKENINESSINIKEDIKKIILQMNNEKIDKNQLKIQKMNQKMNQKKMNKNELKIQRKVNQKKVIKKVFDNKTLRFIIYILLFIIFLLICKILYDNKIITILNY